MSKDEQKKKGTDGRSSTEELSQRILESLPSFTGEETKRWIINMQDDAQDETGPKLKTEGAATELRLSTVALVDKMFDEFQRYFFEFNRATNVPDLKVHCERPVDIREDAKPDPKARMDAAVVLCQGHLSTQHWALVVHAEREQVSCFIVPVDYVVGFKSRRDEFEPFAEIKSHVVKGKQFWEADGFSISYDVLPTLSKLIFEGLIRVARGEAKYTERLSLGPKKLKEAPPPPPPPRPQGPPELLTPSSEFGTPTPSAVASTSSISADRRAGLGLEPEPGTATAPASLAPAFVASGDYSDLLSAHSKLLSVADAVSNSLTQQGMASMQTQDVVNVMKIMKRTSALKALRQQLDDFAREWHKIESES